MPRVLSICPGRHDLWLLSTWSVASETKELNFKFSLIWINWKLKIEIEIATCRQWLLYWTAHTLNIKVTTFSEPEVELFSLRYTWAHGENKAEERKLGFLEESRAVTIVSETPACPQGGLVSCSLENIRISENAPPQISPGNRSEASFPKLVSGQQRRFPHSL